MLGGAVLALLALVACGEDEDTGKKDDSVETDTGGGHDLEDVVVIDGTEAAVKVIDNSFKDENIQIAPGTKVVWTNDGRQNHDIVPSEDGQDWGIDPGDFEPDDVYEYTFETPGTYEYYCSLHGDAEAGMVGAVVVK
jgi:plastocyanin